MTSQSVSIHRSKNENLLVVFPFVFFVAESGYGSVCVFVEISVKKKKINENERKISK